MTSIRVEALAQEYERRLKKSGRVDMFIPYLGELLREFGDELLSKDK